MASPDLPAWVPRLIGLVLPTPSAISALGDLAEEYGFRIARHGAWTARAWIVRETLAIVASYAFGRVWPWLSPRQAAREVLQPRGAWRDVRQAVRGLARSPGLVLLASLTIGAGLATVAITLGFVDALLLQPLSNVHPETLRRVVIVERDGRQTLRASNVEREQVAEAVGPGATLAAASLQPVLVRTGDQSFQTLAEIVSGSYFRVLGTRTSHGRLLVRGDDLPGAAPVAVISEAWWRRLGRPIDILGRSIRVNGALFTVVGVAPRAGSTSSPGASVDVWVPMAAADSVMNPGWRTRIDERWFTMAVRLDRPADVAAVDAALTRAAADLGRTIPEPWRERRMRTGPPTLLVGAQRSTAVQLAIVLVGLALLTLTVVCANVAALLFVRGAAGRRAAAIRLSLGAARGAVLRLALCEGMVLGLVGTGWALVLYAIVRGALAEVSILPTLSLRLDLPWSTPLVAITTAAAVFGGALLALAPAWWLARVQVSLALRDQSGAVMGGTTVARTRRVLVAAQLAVAVVLAVQGAALARTVEALSSANIGVASDRLLALDLDVEPGQGIDRDAGASARLVESLLARVRALPGVVSATLASRAPVDRSTPAVAVSRVGDGRDVLTREVTFYNVESAYFDTIGLPLVRGRSFGEQDAGRDVAIVNETLSTTLLGDADPLDRMLQLEPAGRLVRIVGVARDSRYRSLSEPPLPHLYLPVTPGFGLALIVRTAGPPEGMATTIQQTLDTVGPGVQGFFPRTHRHHLAFDLLPLKTAARAAIGVGVVATALCLIGLYGLLAWLVQIRRAEIGVRVALGAGPRDIVGLVVGQALRTAGPGLATGVVLAAAAARLTRSAMAGVGDGHVTEYAGAVAVLGIAVLAASWLPAQRAAAIDPSESLRRG